MNRAISLIVALLAFSISAPASAGNPQPRAQTLRTLQASVSFFRGDPEIGTDEHFCAGSIVLNRTTAMGAYHCFHGQVPPNEARAMAWNEKWVKVKGVIYEVQERDLALVELDSPIEGTRVADVSLDVGVGDEVIQVGSVDGQPLFPAWGRIAMIGNKLAFENCFPWDRNGIGEQQIMLVNVLQWGGSSGGGLFDLEGNLVGVLVRGHDTGGGTCVGERRVASGGPLWADVIGPVSVRDFLNRIEVKAPKTVPKPDLKPAPTPGVPPIAPSPSRAGDR